MIELKDLLMHVKIQEKAKDSKLYAYWTLGPELEAKLE